MHSSGEVGIPVQIDGAANGNVYNNASSAQEYAYTISVCIEISEDNDKCNTYNEVIDLLPGGHYISSGNPSFQIKFDRAGTFSTSVATQIRSADGLINVESNSYGTVDISSSTVRD